VNLYPRFQFSNLGTDFQNPKPDGVKSGVGELSTFQQVLTDSMQQDIRGRVKEEPELVGLKTMARGPIGLRINLVVFDIVFRIATATVDSLIQHFLSGGLETRDHEPHILAFFRDLDFGNDPPGLFPAVCLVVKACEQLYLLVIFSIKLPGLLPDFLDRPVEHLIPALTDNEFHILVFIDPLMDFRR